MNYVILDSSANLVESYDNETEARENLAEIARQDPSVADDFALIAYDDSGEPVGEAVIASELNHVG